VAWAEVVKEEETRLIDQLKAEGVKPPIVLLSPEQVAPSVGLAVKTLTNQRWLGRHLIPSCKIGRNVAFHVHDVAVYLAGLRASREPLEVSGAASQSKASPSASVASASAPARSRGKALTSRAWLLAMKATIELNAELVRLVEVFLDRERLKDKARKTAGKSATSHKATPVKDWL
jgi:hypothetical protein